MNKALIFDMDGVVVKNHEFHCRAWQIFSEKHGKKVDYNTVISWFGSVNEAILKNFFEKELSEKEIQLYASQKEQIYRDIYREDIKALPGLQLFLEQAEQENFKIALATAAPPANVEFVLHYTGLDTVFNVITDDSQIRNGKPHPEIFTLTAQKLNISPDHCVVFEDSHYGIEAARRAGMKVVGVATTHSSDKLSHTDLVINDFTGISPADIQKLFTN